MPAAAEGESMRWEKTFTVVGCHAEGEVGKVVTGGILDAPGETMFDKKRYLENHADGLRRRRLCEPRGAAAHSANLVLPSNHHEARAGFSLVPRAPAARCDGRFINGLQVRLLCISKVEEHAPRWNR